MTSKDRKTNKNTQNTLSVKKGINSILSFLKRIQYRLGNCLLSSKIEISLTSALKFSGLLLNSFYNHRSFWLVTLPNFPTYNIDPFGRCLSIFLRNSRIIVLATFIYTAKNIYHKTSSDYGLEIFWWCPKSSRVRSHFAGSGYVSFTSCNVAGADHIQVFQAADIFVRLQLQCELMDLFLADDKLRQDFLKPVAD